MLHSEGIGKLAEALAKAQSEIPNVKKNKTADTGKFDYDYADIADGLACVRPVLSKNGLAIAQVTRIEGSALILVTTLLHSSGEWIAGEYPVCSLNGNHQQMGSAMTYARRYALFAMVGVAAENDDDDGKAAAKPEAPPQRKPVKDYKNLHADGGHPWRGPAPSEKAASQEPIDEIPHLNPAQEAAASAKAVVDAARQSAAATATVAKMATDAAMPVDPKAAAIARKEERSRQDADRFSRNSQEVLDRLEGNIAQINPRDKDARAKARAWDQTRKFAQSNLTDEHKLAAMQMAASLLAEIKKAEEAIKKPGAYRPGEDDPLPEHDPATGELAE